MEDSKLVRTILVIIITLVSICLFIVVLYFTSIIRNYDRINIRKTSVKEVFSFANEIYMIMN